MDKYCMVTPCVGVWIEIESMRLAQQAISVTPCVGVWIEIGKAFTLGADLDGHSLRGSVD